MDSNKSTNLHLLKVRPRRTKRIILSSSYNILGSCMRKNFPLIYQLLWGRISHSSTNLFYVEEFSTYLSRIFQLYTYVRRRWLHWYKAKRCTLPIMTTILAATFFFIKFNSRIHKFKKKTEIRANEIES